MDLSIIIVNFNTKDLLSRCIKTITTDGGLSGYHWEIIVVDNGSKDGSVSYIKNQKLNSKNIQIIQNTENAGFGRANNQGVKVAKGKYVLFLNTDIEVLDGAIGTLMKFISSSEHIGIAGGKLYNKDGTAQASCGPFYSLAVTFVMLFLRGDKWGITRYSPSHKQRVDWVSGACFIMKKDDFSSLGGFDEKIFMYMEEVEFMYRARMMGLHIWFDPMARFIHLGAATSNTHASPIINIYRGLLYLYKKHVPSKLNTIKLLLTVKAKLVMVMARIINRPDLARIYEEAYTLVR